MPDCHRRFRGGRDRRIAGGLAVRARVADRVPSWFPATCTGSACGALHVVLACELAPFYRVHAVDERLVLIGPTMDPDDRTRWQQIARLLLDAVREPASLVGVAIADDLRGGPRRDREITRRCAAHPLEARASTSSRLRGRRWRDQTSSRTFVTMAARPIP